MKSRLLLLTLIWLILCPLIWGQGPPGTQHDTMSATQFINRTGITITGATPSVSLSNVFVTGNSGSTTVTNFTGAFPWTHIRVICGDTLTSFQNSANIVMQSGASVTCDLQTAIEFQLDGSNIWHQVGGTGAGGGGGNPGGSNGQLQYKTGPTSFGGTATGSYTAATGVFSFVQLANGNDLINANRFTDTSPTGNFEHFKNAANNTDLWRVDATGTLQAGIISYSLITTGFPAACSGVSTPFATQINTTPGCAGITSAMIPPINLASSANGGVTGNLPTSNLNGGAGASATTAWFGDGTWKVPPGSGTINNSAQFSVPYYSSAGSTNVLSGIAGPSSPAGVLQVFGEVPGGAPGFFLAGVTPRASTCPSNADTVLSTDRGGIVTWSDASPCGVTLPQAGSAGFTANYVFVGCSIGAGAITITPTTSTISIANGTTYSAAQATLVLNVGQCASIYTDSTGSNYLATFRAGSGTVTSVGLQINGSGSSGIFAVSGSPITNSGNLNYNLTGTSGGIPYFSSTSILSSSGLLTASAVVLGGGAGTTPASGDIQDISSVINSAVSNAQNVTYAGGQDASANAILGNAILRGANQTGTGGATSSAGDAFIRGGNNAATNTSSSAGNIQLLPGASTGSTQGLQGLLILNSIYVKGTTVTQWNLECESAAMTVADCAATPNNWAGVAEVVNANTVQIAKVGSQIPINASAAVTLGHTVCAGSTAGKVTDSGGVLSCTNAQGATVGIVMATSGTWVFPDNTSVATSTTLPLVEMNPAVQLSTGGGGGNPTFDKTGTGLLNPTADSTFTQPSTSTTGWTLAGTAPASVSTSTGTNATSLFNVNGVTGGADSNATGTAGIGSSPTIAAGNGGAGTGTNTVGGAGGQVNITAGNGGASAGTGANSNGGNIVLTPGAAGTGGSGAAGKTGIAQVTTGLGTGSAPPGCIAGTAGFQCLIEGTTFTNVSGAAGFYPDSSQHEFLAATNGGSSFGMLVRRQPSAIHQTAQTAAISTATLCPSTAGACNVAGQYHIHFTFIETGTACATPGTGGVTFLLTWTDSNGTAHSAVSVGFDDASAINAVSQTFHFQTTLAAAWGSGDFNVSTNGNVIQYATGYTACTSGTGTYQLDAAVTRIQ